MDDEQTRQQEDWLNSRKNRLPSFTEVLSRRTRPPVDLFMFYLFLQREGAEDILDFWLDVQQHENLCRAYFKDVRKSGRTIKDDWPQYWEYARRRGSIYGTVVGLQPNAVKRSTTSTGDMVNDPEKHAMAHAADEKRGGQRSTTPGVDKEYISSPPTAVNSPDFDPPRSTTPFSLSGRTPTLFNLKRASRAPTVIPRSAAISRLDLIASAERIFFRYLSPSGTVNSPENHEIYLPPALRIHTFPLSSTQEPKSQSDLNMMAHIPDMFHAQKEYCFRAMEQDAFPRFLRSKAFGKPHSRLFIPFAFAILFLISHQYELDPILVFLGQSESTPFRTLTIREPYVRRLLLGRAIWVTTLVSTCVVALTLIFWAVPGHRL
ncbi:RGS domain-containing protein [Suillus clintonianus]|uniref:RGS domain-containing protein n=1 Tax=Suillus clintonianus TaxID=1904413 RepID=UPI001B85B620|nr:RGS domain-containing protein [Suillus clintonianus]KAG2126950.1 RGS domain-containing protein [Suillus clintonianus]